MKNILIDDELLRKARSASGAKTDTETVRRGLEALIRQAAYQRLRGFRGSEPAARKTPRRRGNHHAEKLNLKELRKRLRSRVPIKDAPSAAEAVRRERDSR